MKNMTPLFLRCCIFKFLSTTLLRSGEKDCTSKHCTAFTPQTHHHTMKKKRQIWSPPAHCLCPFFLLVLLFPPFFSYPFGVDKVICQQCVARGSRRTGFSFEFCWCKMVTWKWLLLKNFYSELDKSFSSPALSLQHCSGGNTQETVRNQAWLQ